MIKTQLEKALVEAEREAGEATSARQRAKPKDLHARAIEEVAAYRRLADLAVTLRKAR